jgi:hypothetical protein
MVGANHILREWVCEESVYTWAHMAKRTARSKTAASRMCIGIDAVLFCVNPADLSACAQVACAHALLNGFLCIDRTRIPVAVEM